MIESAKFDTAQQVWVIDVPAERLDDDQVKRTIATAITEIGDAGGGETQLWIHRLTDTADACAVDAGFRAFRDLWQLRCLLPTTTSTLATRAFTPEDIDNLVAVNNRAFAWHPEQSGLTAEKVRQTMTEPWFDADGFRLFERDGALTGFCWTKVHRDAEPPLGEIYVIAIDPSAHGQGLGAPMTRAGLDWLSSQGLTSGMLYVESDNDSANATYRRIGFEHHHTDRAYSLTIATAPPAR